MALAEPPLAAPPARDASVVRTEHLTKRFGDLVAVDDLTFALEHGTVTGFLGPNGRARRRHCGCCSHLVQPSAGRALVFGRRYQDLEHPAAQVGAVLEAADFHPGRSGAITCSRSRWRSGRRGGDGSFLGRERRREGGSTQCLSWSS